MAKPQPQQHRDSIADLHPEAAANEAVLAAPVPDYSAMTDKQILRALAESQLALVEAQKQAALNIAGQASDREHFAKREREDIAAHERIKAECNKTTTQRSQEACDRRWPRKPSDAIFVCQMFWKGKPDQFAFPRIRLWAASREEADGRYRTLCGLNAVEEPARLLVTEDEGDEGPAPKAKAKKSQPQQFGEMDERLPAGVEVA